MTKLEEMAEALFLYDRDKVRPYDILGYAKIMYGDPPCGWDDLAEPAKEPFRDQVRAAVEAMRQPTKEMIEAGWATAVFYDQDIDEPIPPIEIPPQMAWVRMIDAVLNETAP